MKTVKEHEGILRMSWSNHG